MAGTDLNPHGREALLTKKYRKKNNRSSRTYICPRPDTQLKYMIDIALTMEFILSVGGGAGAGDGGGPAGDLQQAVDVFQVGAHGSLGYS